MRLASKIVVGLGFAMALGSAQAQWGPGPGGRGGPGSGGGGGGGGGWGGHGGWGQQWQCFQNARPQQGSPYTFSVTVRARDQREAAFRAGPMLSQQEQYYGYFFPNSWVWCQYWGK